MHGIRNMRLAGSPAVSSRPAEAARCFEVACEPPEARLPSEDVAGTYCRQNKPIPIRDQCQLQVGWVRLARAVRLAPTTSLHFSRSNARGRSDLHSPKDAWTSQTHVRPGIRQDRRGMQTASSPFCQNGDSSLAATCRSGFRQQIDGVGWPRATTCIDTRDPRDEACSVGWVTGRPRYSARRAKVGFGGEFGGSRAARAHGTHAWVWVWDRRSEQLARMERDWAAHTTALGTADAAKG
jgi:hypothetical protein